jgi:hypothetical protein
MLDDPIRLPVCRWADPSQDQRRLLSRFWPSLLGLPSNEKRPQRGGKAWRHLALSSHFIDNDFTTRQLIHALVSM